MFDMGARIKQIRKDRNIKLINLAHDSGISQPSLSNVENGKKTLSIETLEKVCDALGVSLSEFFSPQQKELPPKQYELLQAVEHLSDTQLDSLINLINSFKK